MIFLHSIAHVVHIALDQIILGLMLYSSCGSNSLVVKAVLNHVVAFCGITNRFFSLSLLL
jgi:hypothetical protein